MRRVLLCYGDYRWQVCYEVDMYVARIPNRGSPPAILLRESYRDGGKVKNRTLANLSHWPEPKVDALARTLKGLPPKLDLSEAFEITRSLPHGHVAAVLGTAQRLRMPELLDATPSRKRDLVTAMLVAQVIDPGSKLAVARGLRTETATSSLGQLLGVSGCDKDDLYAAMDWALAHKDAIEKALAARHLVNGTLVLYDVSSAAFEGRTCPLGAIGHARDGVKGRLQIVYGLLCSPAGMPIAIEVFEGSTADPKTLAAQITKLKTRFGLARVCLVGDRGMLTNARIRDEIRPAQLDWISALRAPQIKALVDDGALQLSLFDTQDLVEIDSPDFPGERLVCCHNPVLAEERARKRGELLAATEKELAPIGAATRREKRPLRGRDRIALRVGKVINHYKMAKHFTLEITDESFTFTRNTDDIAAEAALDGIYVLRTSLPTDSLPTDDVVARYKNLADVERFFRTLNSELDVRPIRHRLADRVRAHMFLRMLSYYISWHMKQVLAPILFQDNDKPAAAAKRANPVAPAQRSDEALHKAARKRTDDDTPVHSFTSLLADLATICANQIQPTDDTPPFTMTTTPTPLQRRAFELLNLSHRHGPA
jgi:Transposase DDE domain